MSLRRFNILLLLIASVWSTTILADESSGINLDGLQLAFTRYKRSPVTEEPTTQEAPSKPPTPLPAAVPQQEIKPVTAPKVKPAPTPITEPAITQTIKSTESKQTANQSPSSEWLMGIGADFGGDELGQVKYSDGSTASLNANKGVVVYVGGNISNGQNSPFTTMLTIGYKIGAPKGISGDITWSSVPFDVIEFYYAGSFRSGLGMSYQIKPLLTVSTPSVNYVDQYNNAIGLIAQIGWAPVKSSYRIDVRYTSIKYQATNVQGPTTVGGSVVGAYLSFRL